MMRVPFFIVLLPVFFVLHNLSENYVPVLVGDAAVLTFIYILIATILTAIGWLLMSDLNKAAIWAFLLLCIQFFFGSTHDFLKESLKNNFLTRYSFLLPLILILIAGSFFLLKRSKSRLTLGVQFLNLLMIILIILDVVFLIPKISAHNSDHIVAVKESTIACDTCKKPDFYLIIADEYAGDKALQELFKFDNSEFKQALTQRGFHVSDSSISNYNATVYSMASLLNLQYITGLQSRIVNHPDMLSLQELIEENYITVFFKKLGYKFYNHSYFNFADKKRLVRNPFYPTKRSLFTAQTLTRRLQLDLGFHLASRQKIESIVFQHRYNNQITDSITRVITKPEVGNAKFVYVHLELPHHPYYYDSMGKPLSFEQVNNQDITDRTAYINYLKYSNDVLLSLIDHIRQNSQQPPVIMLLSDHGFRQGGDTTDKDYYFSNFNAVYLPSGNYFGFYRGISNVNTMRLVLNNQFGQQFKLMKDSTFLFEEPSMNH